MKTKISTTDFHLQLKNTLKNAGFSLTDSRRVVFDGLLKGPITHAHLSNTVASNMDRATVYRTLDLFERLGIINRIWHEKKTHVELSEIFLPHHHHAVCQHCGNVTDITSGELEQLLSRIARENNFLAVEHGVELSGYCARCHSAN